MLYKLKLQNMKFIALLILCGFLRAGLVSAQVAEDDLKPLMHEAFGSLTYLVYTSELLTGGNELGSLERTLEHVERLKTAASQIEEHTRGNQNQALWLNSRRFMDSLDKLNYAYQRDDQYYVQYYILDMLDNCFACHSRQEMSGEFPLGERLIGGSSSLENSALEATDLARLQVAVRQFEAAVTTLEDYLLDPYSPIGSHGYAEAMTEYLFLNINVFNDFNRASNTLKALTEEVPLPQYLISRISDWSNHLELLAGQKASGLSDIQDLYDTSNNLSAIPFDRSRLVYDIVVRSLLEKYLDRPQNILPKDLSSIYFMLGVIEYRLERQTSSVPQAELYFEAAIRADPASATALQAYNFLEENIGYVSSSNVYQYAESPVPLRELYQLIDMSSEG